MSRATAEGPSARGRRLYLVALAIDSLGNGLWMPIALIFYTRGQHLPLGAVGATLTVGGLVGLLTGPVGGKLVDRWGPANAAALSNALRTVVFALFPMVHSVWLLGLLAVVTSSADRLFWTANTPLLARLVPDGALMNVLASVGQLKILGWAVGAAVGAGAGGLLIGSPTGLHLAAYANGLTFFITMALIMAVRPYLRTAAKREPATTMPHRPDWRWRDLRADRGFVGLCLLTFGLAFASDCLTAMLPLVAVEVLKCPPWIPGAIVIATCVSISAARRPAIAYAARTSATRALRLAGALFGVAFLMMAPSALAGSLTATVIVLGTALVASAGDALFAPVTTTMADAAAPPGLKGRYSAVFQTAWGAAGAAAPAAGAILLSVGNSVLWLSLAALCAIMIPLIGLLARVRTPAEPLPEPLPEPVPMRRIVVGGITGAGKTTLATNLASALGIPRIDMDALYHGAHWSRRREFESDVERATAGNAWVCDAQYHRLVGDLLAERADTFVWLDLPRWTVMRRVTRRSIARAFTGRSVCNGNRETWRRMLFDPRHPVRWAWTQHANRRAETAAFVAAHPELNVIHLTSGSQAKKWLRESRPIVILERDNDAYHP